MIKEKFKHILYRYVLPYAGLFMVKLIFFTYRVRILDQKKETDVLLSKKGLIYASWHQRFFPGITFFSTRKPIAIMISKSLDGELIARAVDALGWYPVRGSSSRGGKKALQKVKELAFLNYKIGHIVDGPRGPFGIVKPGLLKIAQAADLPIVPTITSSQNKWVFKSWDRFMVPKPFSRVIIRFGDAISVLPELGRGEFEEKRLLIEKQMRNLYEDTDRIWFYPEKVREIFK
ncbi:MAG: lysophospholipid acyltransferase family protein [Deltaproteobacteria bacterium]|nr:lysophospholipid acyltransferase family protein [Deltaproteobacteria bacterium]